MAEADGGALADVLGVDPTLKPARPTPAPGVAQPAVVPEETGSPRDLVLGKGPPAVTEARNPDRLFTSRGYSSLYDIPGELFQTIKRDLTPQIHWPGSTPAPPPPTGSPGSAGVVQGLKDVGYTVGGELNKRLVAPIVDAFSPGTGTESVKRLEEQRRAGVEAFQKLYGDSNWAEAGRIGGQFLGSAPLLGPAGKLLQAGSRFVPGLGFISGAKPAENLAARGVQLATEGATQGAEFGALTSAKSDDSVVDQAIEGAKAGAVAAPVLGAALGTVRKLSGVAGGADPLKASLAQRARDELGVNVPLVERPKSALSGTQMADVATRREMQKVVMQEMGENANVATPEVMEAAHTRLSQGFTDLARRVQTVDAGGMTLANDMQRIARDLADAGVGADATKAVQRQMRDVIERFYGPTGGGPGQLSGEGWLALTAKDGRLETAIKNAPGAVKGFLVDIREALNRRLVASAGPDEAEAAQALRRQWRVMRTVEDAVQPGGDLSFNKLATSIEKAAKEYDPISKQYAYDNQGKMNLIARVGREFLGTQPDSTTAARLTGSSLTRMAYDALTRGVANVVQAIPRTPWATQNAINTTLGRPTQDVWSAAIPAVEPLLGPAVAASIGERDAVRRRQQQLMGQ